MTTYRPRPPERPMPIPVLTALLRDLAIVLAVIVYAIDTL